MVRADYTARAELHIRSNAASRSLTRNTPPVQSEKKGTQNKTAQLLSVPHRPPRLSCPRWRHIAWHWTPSMRCVPPCRAHIHAPHHPRHTNSSSFDARRLLPSDNLSRGSTCMRPHNTQHTASTHTHIHTHTHQEVPARVCSLKSLSLLLLTHYCCDPRLLDKKAPR